MNAKIFSGALVTTAAFAGTTYAAPVTLVSGADYSLSDASTSPFNDDANIVAISSLSATSTLNSSFSVTNLTDGLLGNGASGDPFGAGRWVSNAANATVTFNFTGGADLQGC